MEYFNEKTTRKAFQKNSFNSPLTDHRLWRLAASSAIVLHLAYSKLRADGRPMTLDEIIPPHISDKDNAAPFYLVAAAMLESKSVKAEYTITISRLEYLYRISVYLTFRAVKLLDHIEYANSKPHISVDESGWRPPVETRKGLLSGREYTIMIPPILFLPDPSLSDPRPPTEAYGYMNSILSQPCIYEYSASLSDLYNLSSCFLSNRITDNELVLFRRLMANDAVSKAMQLIDDAFKKPECRFDVNYEAGIYMRLNHLSKIRFLNSIICARIRFMVENDDASGAWSSAMDCLKIADSIRREPIPISQLVRRSMIENAADAIYYLSSFSLPDADVSTRLQKSLAALEDITPFVRAIDCERIINNMDMHRLFEKDRYGYSIIHPIYKFVPWYASDKATYNRLMHLLVNAFEKENFSSGLAIFRRYPGTQEEYFSEYDIYELIPRHYLVTRFLFPSLLRMHIFSFTMVAKARLTRLSLAIIDYHREHGSYPENLEQTGAKNLIDPFTGKSLIYRREPEGFVIYSVGDDQTDDGGHYDLKEPWNDKDIVLRYPKPPQPKRESNFPSQYLRNNTYAPNMTPPFVEIPENRK